MLWGKGDFPQTFLDTNLYHVPSSLNRKISFERTSRLRKLSAKKGTKTKKKRGKEKTDASRRVISQALLVPYYQRTVLHDSAYANTRDIGCLIVLTVLLLNCQSLTRIRLHVRHVVWWKTITMFVCAKLSPAFCTPKLLSRAERGFLRVVLTLSTRAASAITAHRHLGSHSLRQGCMQRLKKTGNWKSTIIRTGNIQHGINQSGIAGIVARQRLIVLHKGCIAG